MQWNQTAKILMHQTNNTFKLMHLIEGKLIQQRNNHFELKTMAENVRSNIKKLGENFIVHDKNTQINLRNLTKRTAMGKNDLAILNRIDEKLIKMTENKPQNGVGNMTEIMLHLTSSWEKMLKLVESIQVKQAQSDGE